MLKNGDAGHGEGMRTMRALVRLAALAAVAAALASCDEHDKSQNQPTPADRLAQALPPDEAEFKRALVASYAKDQAAYDTLPNKIVQDTFTRDASVRLCAFMQTHSSFRNWKGILTKLDEDYKRTPSFTIDIGNGFELSSDTDHPLDKNSDASRILSQLRIGDVVTVSGEIIVSYSGGTCDRYPEWRFDFKSGSGGTYYVSLATLNGASAVPPPPPPPPPAPPAPVTEAAPPPTEETTPPESTPNK